MQKNLATVLAEEEGWPNIFEILPRTRAGGWGFVSGHDFSRAEELLKKMWALQAAEKLLALKGHDFSRAVNGAKSTLALAAEGRSSGISPRIESFSASSLALRRSLRLQPGPTVKRDVGSQFQFVALVLFKMNQLRILELTPPALPQSPANGVHWRF
ncbi:MAG: hypothetical protein ACRD3N_06690 [Terracidiphilus sp.]